MLLDGGDLRYVAVGGQEVIRRIYVGVRDEQWHTITPRYTLFDVTETEDGFVVWFTAEHVEDDVDFVCEGSLVGTGDGTIVCTMDGTARATFRRNRIGWCLLQPVDLAGTAVTATTTAGIVLGAFPDMIAPNQPFIDLLALEYATADGGRVSIRFEGDLFEMEDQRNWTDASYKTYSTPARLPIPVTIERGTRIRQTVTIAIRSGSAESPDGTAPRLPAVRVGGEAVATLPPIGLGAASHGEPLSATERAALAVLGPAHLRLSLDAELDGWRVRLDGVAADAAALGAGLELEIVAGDAGEGLDVLLPALLTVPVSVVRVLIFPRTAGIDTEVILRRARDLADRIGLIAPLGGGSRTNFTDLNRAPPPHELLDVVGYAMNPQVHAFDNASMVESLAGQAATVRSARALVGDRPLAVGPITLRPRSVPKATTTGATTWTGGLPRSVDARQMSLFAAAWTVGSVRRLAEAGAASLTYFETTGWRGVMERGDHPLRVASFVSWPGMRFPVYHVFADLAPFAGADVLAVDVGDGLAVEAIALRRGDQVRVLVASVVNEPMTVVLDVPPLVDLRMRSLDERTFLLAATDRDAFVATTMPIPVPIGLMTLDLLPFAVVCLDGRPPNVEGATA